ncbi:MAG TPA: protein kinase [Acidobacteriota bacterium]|nr:protein kinase [Acidobacteriota bacterium]
MALPRNETQGKAMKPERWQEIVRLYYAALERKPEERADFVKEGCGGNESLRKEVESLLACRPRAEKFMESPALEAAGGILPENPQAGSTEGNARQKHEIPGEASARSGRRWMTPPWWILFLSVPFVACAGFLYSWLFFGPEPAGWMLQLDNRVSAEGWNRITSVGPHSPAARAGFQRGDLIPSRDLDQFRAHPQAAGQTRFQVKRGDETTELTLTRKGKDREYWLGSEGIRALLLIVDSVLYLILAGILVVMRPQDSLARWGAILLAQFGVFLPMTVVRIPGSSFMLESAHALRSLPIGLGPVILLGMSICTMGPAGAFGFLGGFPRTPLTGRRAWLFTWVPGIVVTIPVDLRMYWLPVYAGANGPVIPIWLLMPGWVLGVCYLAASVVLLMHNYRKIEERNERRRLRLVATGFGINVFAMAANLAMQTPVAPIERFHYAYWLPYFEPARPLLVALIPICTAYAILRHRMFDIHVMIRLGLRYAAARGLLLSIIPATALVLAVDLMTHGNQPLVEIARRRGLLYAAAASGAFLLHVRQKTWLNALDRRFFREHYDARRLLSAVVEDVRRAETFDQAASHVISQIEASLHPKFAGFMVHEPGAASFRSVVSTFSAPAPIPAHSRLIALIRLLDKPLENSQGQSGRLQQELPLEDLEYLKETGAEWLFPVTLGGTGTEAVLVLGPKRSEEPYSQEDREILSAITGSLALLLERSLVVVPIQSGFGECQSCGRCYDSGVAICETDSAGLSTLPYSLTLARRYRFERRLGRGGMGTVYQARDVELERLVAVKVIRSERMPGTDAVARFRREAKAAAGFSHPNVVTVYDFGVAEDGRAYLVMELLSGCSLREELVRCGRLDTKRVLEIVSGVGSAIAAAHDRMLLHRDIKPENIFLTKSGGEEVAKILDFGLAKTLAQEEAMDSMPDTAPGILIGTLPYMSPERMRGTPATESCDIWALAVMAFEMLTGVHPFASSADWRMVLHGGQFPALNADAPGLTQGLKEFFERSLAADRSRRPLSARQFLTELQAALQEQAYLRA